jgi:hypothetical protein
MTHKRTCSRSPSESHGQYQIHESAAALTCKGFSTHWQTALSRRSRRGPATRIREREPALMSDSGIGRLSTS